MHQPHRQRSSYPPPQAGGKFIRVDGQPLLIRGTSYGTFAPDGAGSQFPPPARVAADFELMTAHGFNTVRVYTPPPATLLDQASRHGLRVIVGIPWPQHIAFLDDRALRRSIRLDVEKEVRRVADHPAVLLFAVGNEVPASIVRWHGRHRIERFLRELYDAAKSRATDRLVTYVNYPPTDYLELPFLDVVAFNVYLHDDTEMRSYLARLHHIAGNRPLLLAEAGADALRHGEEGQAALTAMQLRAAYEGGACGAIAFNWTDEWWRGGHTVEDWAFGLVDRERRPKLALAAASRVFASAPFRAETRQSWPTVSVVVCVYNASETLDDCLASLGRLTYPDVEVIVVDDGSTDDTADIARDYPSARLVQIPNGGLSAARNVGMAEATGDIVAYIDGDVRVEAEWLTYLVQPLLESGFAGAGGPNVVPADDPWFSQCVARAPGGPSHVLLDDHVAEHVPGCNMAFRRDVLLTLDGFNPIFLRAGDDVDLCWRLQARGWKIGFAPAAMVWHHHRASLGAFWRQQAGYGEGETWLKPLHPQRFAGRRAIWRGHIYSALPFVRSLRRSKVNVGVWGSAAFPSVYRFDVHPFAHLPHSGRWQATSLSLIALGLALLPTPLAAFGPALCLAGFAGLGVTISKCVQYAFETEIAGLSPPGRVPRWASRLTYRVALAGLHFIQPLARLYGRGRGYFAAPRRRPPGFRQTATGISVGPLPAGAWRSLGLLTGASLRERFWGERWVNADVLLDRMTDWLRLSRAVGAIEVDEGWRADRDFSVAIGRLIWLDVRAVVEDHGAGRCLLRVATRARATRLGGFLGGAVAGCAGIAFGGMIAGWAGAGVLGLALVVGATPFAVWPVLRTAAVVREAIAKVTAESGLTRLSSAAAPDRVRAAARGEADDGQPAARPVRHRAPVEKVASVPSPAPATHSGRVAR